MTTRRVISVWLPDWRTDRLQRRRPELREKLLVLIHAGKGGDRIVAVNAVARERGLAPQMALADARAIAPGLTSLAHDAEAELLELEALARWCGRYSPLTAADPPDGLWLDVTGAAHLFGGETALLKAVQADMSRMGLACRAAIADTPGAAWALARFGSAAPAGIPPGAQKEHLAALPVAGLRLAPETTRQLERLGLKHIGQLYEIAPAALRSRFGVAVPQRLAQALGREKEPISPLLHEPAYYATLRLGEPVGTLSDVEAAIDILAAKVTGRLTAHGKGARRFTLTLYGAMGGRFPLAVGTSRLTSDAAHVKRLFRERLAALENRFDAAFGADAFSLQAEGSGALVPHQGELGGADAGTAETAILIDRLQARLGRDAVLEFACRESHVPERAVYGVRAGSRQQQSGTAPPLAPRPLLLLPRPEPIRAIAEVPDYPPHRFEWRRRTYSVARAEGPERIAVEWWRQEAEGDYRTRDYFRVEDPSGARFWIFRLGLMERPEGAVQWFMHGLFP